MIQIFGKSPGKRERRSLVPSADDFNSMSTNLPQNYTERGGATSSRFRQALRNVEIPLHDRRPNPYKGNLKQHIAKMKQFDFTLD